MKLYHLKGTTTYVVFEVISSSSIQASAQGYVTGRYTPLTIDYDLANGISQTISTISTADIYKFYLPVKYGQIGKIKMTLPSETYSFANGNIYEYSTRDSSNHNEEHKLTFNKSTENSNIILTASKTVSDTRTEYLAFQFSSSYEITDLVILGNTIDNYNDETDKIIGSHYILKSGETKDIGPLSPYPTNVIFVYLPIKKDETVEFTFSFSLIANFYTFYQPFIVYECTERYFTFCTYIKTLNLTNDISKDKFKISYTATQNYANYLLFKIKPNIYYETFSITATTEDDSNSSILIVIIIIVSIIIILLIFYILYKYYYKRKLNNENINPSEEISSSDKNLNILPSE